MIKKSVDKFRKEIKQYIRYINNRLDIEKQSEIDKNVKVGRTEISVTLCGKMKVPFSFFAWEEEKMNGVWEMQEKKTFDRTKPVDFIRACRKVEKIVH